MLFSYEKNTLRTDIALLILRIAVGGMMLFSHGWGKMMKFFGEGPITFGNPIGIGEEASLVLTVFAELFCSILLIIGLATRWATIPLMITMLVAIFIVHGADPFGKKEFALLYLIPYIVLLLTGAGRVSLDALFNKTKNA
ncbi:MAG: putative oxidoreductase [Saprospiraceae bacterium]|jgi:putative oxidoreductase